MPTVKFGDRFGIAFSGFGLDQHTLLEMCLELALQRDEERSAIVTVPIGEAAWCDLGVVDLNLHLRVARQRGNLSYSRLLGANAPPSIAVNARDPRHDTDRVQKRTFAAGLKPRSGRVRPRRR